jgi:hypothetical protein
MDRRTTLKWMMAVAALPSIERAFASPAKPPAGYGTDPDLTKLYRAGTLWPLTFDAAQRRTAAALCATIIPADEHSPGAAEVGVDHFIDEWVSAPYPRHAEDRALIVDGLAWIDRESVRRFGKPFPEVDDASRRAICDDICWAPKAAPELAVAARFFARYRDLTADGFYTTPEGTKDIGYVGNKARAAFEGPPIDALKKAGLA